MKLPYFVRGDIDGFFGLFIDNLLQLMLILVLCQGVCGFPSEMVLGRILPGAAVSILVGNLFYAWQARKLARETGRTDVTALPYGINTVSLLAFIFLIMAPIYHQTKDADLAWRAGLFACFWSGIIETAGAFVGDIVRRNTPRAALLSALAGIAITFIAMGFVFQIFASPIVAIIPMFLILIQYSSGARMPFGLPGGLLAIVIGTALAWIARANHWIPASPPQTAYHFAFYLPSLSVRELIAFLTQPHGWQYFAVIFPMGLFTVVGSLQNLESAEAAGDRFPTRPSLLVNGIGTMVAACFGSAFPTTLYIGHPGWKAMGARAGYSTLNGIVITLLCLFGGIAFVLQYIPIEATLGILLWIGFIMTAQSFQEVPKKHALAVAMGLMPALANWALVLIETALRKAGTSLPAIAPKFGGDLYIDGVIALSQGFLLTSMIFSALMVQVIEHRFLQAAVWAFMAAAASSLGLIHAYRMTDLGVQNHFGYLAAPSFAAAYVVVCVILLVMSRFSTRQDSP
jgi:AGZA family xanthine/uracil permease-like MFS transporter